jgi:hypothetical protein
VYWRGVTSAAGTTATMASVYLLGVKLEWSTNASTD